MFKFHNCQLIHGNSELAIFTFHYINCSILRASCWELLNKLFQRQANNQQQFLFILCIYIKLRCFIVINFLPRSYKIMYSKNAKCKVLLTRFWNSADFLRCVPNNFLHEMLNHNTANFPNIKKIQDSFGIVKFLGSVSCKKYSPHQFHRPLLYFEFSICISIIK